MVLLSCSGGSTPDQAGDTIAPEDPATASAEGRSSLEFPVDDVRQMVALAAADEHDARVLLYDLVDPSLAEQASRVAEDALADLVTVVPPGTFGAARGAPLGAGTSAVTGALGSGARLQDMSSPGTATEGGANAPIRTTTTVQGSRLEIRVTWSATLDTDDGDPFDVSGSGAIRLDVCPDQGGQVVVELEVTERANQAGSTARMTITGRTVAAVGDDAEVTSVRNEWTTGLDAQSPTAGNAFVEYTSTGSRGPAEVSRTGGSGRLAGSGQLRTKLESAAEFATVMAIDGARERWQNGFCVEIVADVPGIVKPGESTSFQATVRHRFDGTNPSVPIDVELQGRETLEPRRIERAPGQLTYRAPADKDQSATVKLSTT